MKSSNLILSHRHGDGRPNSLDNEDEVIEEILKYYNTDTIEVPVERNWFDFAIHSGDEFMPVNIKVTTMTTCDNVNSKSGLVYALSGDRDLAERCHTWPQTIEALHEARENITEDGKDADYWCLVVNKNDTSDVYATSLKQLKELTANGNNLPFQSHWGKNKEKVERSYDEAFSFLCGVLAESLKKKAQANDIMKEMFGEFYR